MDEIQFPEPMRSYLKEQKRLQTHIDKIWAKAKARYDNGDRPIRFLGCSYYVVDSGQKDDLHAWLTQEEADKVHQLSMLEFSLNNSAYLAKQRIIYRHFSHRAKKSMREFAPQLVWLYFQL